MYRRMWYTCNAEEHQKQIDNGQREKIGDNNGNNRRKASAKDFEWAFYHINQIFALISNFSTTTMLVVRKAID